MNKQMTVSAASMNTVAKKLHEMVKFCVTTVNFDGTFNIPLNRPEGDFYKAQAAALSLLAPVSMQDIYDAMNMWTIS